MKKPKLFSILLTLFFVLSFTFGAVKADVEPPEDEFDPDEPLITGDLPALEGAASFNRLDWKTYKDPSEDTTQPEDAAADRAAGDPIAPDTEDVYDKTPTYSWYYVASALKYKVDVYNYFTNKLIYTLSAKPGNCFGGICYKTAPDDLKLKTYDLADNGFYKWRVRYLIGTTWYSTGYYGIFDVISTGFNSTFDVNANKWLSVFGTWTRVDPGYLKTGGVAGYWASAIQKELFLDFSYEVKMKRKNNDGNSNNIYFYSTPYPLASNGGLNDCYMLQYTNDGFWSVWLHDDLASSPIKDWTYNPTYIIPYGWNILKVVADYPYLDMWLNGHYLGYIYDPNYLNYGGGWVGVSKYDKDVYNDKLLVDYARLTSYYTNSTVERDPAMQLGLDPVDETHHEGFAP